MKVSHFLVLITLTLSSALTIVHLPALYTQTQAETKSQNLDAN